LADKNNASPAAGVAGRAPTIARKALTAAIATFFLASLADTADAGRKQKRPAVSKYKKDVPIRHPFGEDMPKGPLQLVVSIADQRITLYSNGVRVAQAPVSTGVDRHPTPTGIFSVIQKNRWHRSNLYGNAPMWYMHRLTWSGIALHEGVLPGRPASHGCIRLPQHFVSRLWNISKLGVRVVIAPTDLSPRDFSHPKLFEPLPAFKPTDAGATAARPMDDRLRSTLNTVEPEHLVQVVEASPGAPDRPTATDAPEPAAGRAAAPDAELRTTSAADALPALPSEPLLELSAEPLAPHAQSLPDKPVVDADDRQPPRPAPLRSRFAEPTKLAGQVAVFISRKEKKIFVRHAFVPVFDMPIEIADPERPLGTHLYTAIATAGDGGMRWNVITMPRSSRDSMAAAGGKGAKSRNARARNKAPKQVSRAALLPASNAVEALERVTIPPQAIERINELLVPGSSLIISDEGLGRETGRYTEFIVETR
jgi:lipoprotein-anchoring transpeptidase ErfK/SrfK